MRRFSRARSAEGSGNDLLTLELLTGIPDVSVSNGHSTYNPAASSTRQDSNDTFGSFRVFVSVGVFCSSLADHSLL